MNNSSDLILIDDDIVIELLEEGRQGPPGIGMPLGGTTGQIPYKRSGDDFDIGWKEEANAGASPVVSIEVSSDQTLTLTSPNQLSSISVDNAVLTLVFPAAATLTANTLEDFRIFIQPSNGGIVRFTTSGSDVWINTKETTFDVDILCTAVGSIVNDSSFTGGFLQVDPLNTRAQTRDGIADYNDTSTATTPLTLTGGVWVDIPNDGLGPFSNLDHLPSDTTTLLDTTTGYIDLRELNFGDTCLIRNDYSVTPATNNALLEFRYILGTGAGEYTLSKIVGRLDSGSGIPYRFSLSPDMLYVGDANTRDNPVKLQVKLSGNGTLVNSGTAIGVVRK